MRTPTTKVFLAWLQAQPAEDHYNYFDSFGCAITQFLHQAGAPTAVVGASFWCERLMPPQADTAPRRNLPHKWNKAVKTTPWTFGAAAARLAAAGTKRSKAHV